MAADQVPTLSLASAWAASAVKNDAGVEPYCYTMATYANKMVLALGRTRAGEMVIAVALTRRDLPAGQQVPLVIRVSDKVERQRTGTLGDDGLLAIANGRDDEFWAALGRGRRLEIDAGQDRIAFDLSGSTRALADVTDCAKRKLPDQPSVPAPPRAAAAAAAAPPVVVDNGITLPPRLVALLALGGFQGLVPLKVTDSQGGARAADYAWQAGPLIGGIREAKVTIDGGLATATRIYIDSLREQCQGEFAADQSEIEPLQGLALRTASASCTGPAGFYRSCLFYLSDAGVFTILLHNTDLAHRQLADQARDIMANVVRRLAGKVPTD